jgi:ABC-type amino acid transport substrate-binding protein
MMKKWTSIAATVMTLSIILSGCGTSSNGSKGSSDSKTLKMATSADYPPFEYVDTAKGDKIVGYDIDLANAIGKELGYKIEVKDMDFSGLVTALKTDQADIVLSAMTPTEKRKKNVDFTDVYYSAQDMIVSLKDKKIEKPEDMKGKTIGVQLGSIQEDAAKDIKKKVDLNIETRNRIPELVQELQNGHFDAVIIENTVAKGYLNKDDKLNGTVMKSNEAAGSAIALPKGSKLTSEFNKVLKKMKDNGEMDKLAEKWFGKDTE